MELSLESALSAKGLLGHLSYLLLIVSMLSQRMLLLRIGVVGSARAGIAYAVFILHDPVAVFWESMLLLVNLFQIIRFALRERIARFKDEELQLRQIIFSELSNFETRNLLNLGFWIDASPGEELIREESAVDNLYYLFRGEATVYNNDNIVGYCKTGDQIGEGTILASNSASGTVIVSKKSQLWCVPAPKLRHYLSTRPDVRNQMERRIGDSLKSKLHESNRTLASIRGS